jgi:hypothetical protein
VANNTELFTILEELVDGWCERRTLNALALVLPNYPALNGLTDGWHQLYDALRDVRAMCKDELNNEEREKLNQAIAGIESLLDHG